MSAASDNLRNNQEQCDLDGCMVKVSRQAVEETLAEYDQMLALLIDLYKHSYATLADHARVLDVVEKASPGALKE